MLSTELQERKKELQRVFQTLSGTTEIVRLRQRTLETGEAVVTFQHSVRILRAGLRFTFWEEFRDVDTDPHLYAFSYHVSEEHDFQNEQPLFRYECHPDIEDPVLPTNHISENTDFSSPYAREPHFHPDNTVGERIRKLHYPFHRSERKTVVFALVNWLQVDLVRRFHPV
jgi:hypothetical protein